MVAATPSDLVSAMRTVIIVGMEPVRKRTSWVKIEKKVMLVVVLE